MNRAALFFDIDGTVLSEITKEIPASTIDALKRAHDAGHFLFINTGRTYCSVPVELKKLPFDGYLCGCGIYFTFDEEVIFEKHLDPERGDEIADYMTKCQIDGIFEGAEDVYFTSRVSRFDRLENTKKYMNNRGLSRRSMASAPSTRSRPPSWRSLAEGKTKQNNIFPTKAGIATRRTCLDSRFRVFLQVGVSSGTHSNRQGTERGSWLKTV